MTSARRIEHNDTRLRFARGGACLPVLALFLAAHAGRALAQTGPLPANPIGPGTVPPSSYEKGLPTRNSTPGDRSSRANLPSPTENSGNLLITGNVTGGQYFHGYLPYGSTTSIGAPLGSTQLDSFLRYTAMPPEPGGYPGGYSQFYSPTGTVATMPPGYGGAVLMPSSPRVAGGLGVPTDRPADVLTMSEMPPYQAVAGPTGSAFYGSYDRSAGAMLGRTPAGERGWNGGHESAIHNPQSARGTMTPPDLTANMQPVASQGDGLMTPEDYRLQLEQLQQDIERVKANALALEQSLQTNDVPSAPAAVPPSGALALPHEQSGRPIGHGGPDEGLRLEPRVPDPAPAPGESQSMSGPRVVDVKWLPQADQMNRVSSEGPAQLHPPLTAGSARPEQSLPAPNVMAERVDAVFAAQGRSGGAGHLWTELQTPQTGRTVPGMSNSASSDSSRLPVPPAPGVKPSPEQISTLIARLRGTSAGAHTVTGNDQPGALPDSSQQLRGNRPLAMYRNPAQAFGAPQGDDAARLAAARPEALGMTDNIDGLHPNNGAGGSFTQERFDRCMAAAELYLRQGRYYRAAESFTLAATYQPNDARVHLGKSYALFAAGEYLSSALYLARAIELDPRAVLGRSDLVNAIGGPEAFAPRITDLERCAGTGDAPQLQFLLAYVYGQMNRPAEARAAMAAAEKQLAPAPAVELLKVFVSRF